jgi:1,4-alpha-glucan branching enzyme
MPGDDRQRFANLRALYGYMYGHPGRKLLFMGSEFAQRSEWNAVRSLDWNLLEHHPHRGMQRWVRDLNHFYRDEPALHAADDDPGGFEWIDFADTQNVVVSFLRRAEGAPDLLFVCNLTPVAREGYRLGVPGGGDWELVLNSDARVYGGTGYPIATRAAAEATPWHGRETSIVVDVPPLSTIALRRVA